MPKSKIHNRERHVRNAVWHILTSTPTGHTWHVHRRGAEIFLKKLARPAADDSNVIKGDSPPPQTEQRRTERWITKRRKRRRRSSDDYFMPRVVPRVMKKK